MTKPTRPSGKKKKSGTQRKSKSPSRAKAKSPKSKGRKATAGRRKGSRKKKGPSGFSALRGFLRRCFPAALIVLFLGCLTTCGMFIHVDLQVKEAIAARAVSSSASIVGLGLSASRAMALGEDSFVEQLRKRQYKKVARSPELPGQYRLEGNSYTVYRRSYVAPDGTTHPARAVHIHFSPPSPPSLEPDELLLEPREIAPLLNSENRSRDWVPLDVFPEHLQKSVMAIEDERFYRHIGIDVYGIIRALIVNIRAGRIVQGGSTITQQLAKNVLLSPERSIRRKLLEALAAVSLEVRLSKKQILEWYLNEVYLGQQGAYAIHGMRAASNAFFSKAVQGLTAAESALLAGLIQAPSYYSPVRHPNRAKERAWVVAGKLADQNIQVTRSDIENVKFAFEVQFQRRAPHFVSEIRREISNRFRVDSLSRSSLLVHTGLVPEFQDCAEQSVQRHASELVKRYGKAYEAVEIALVAMHPSSGLVTAWVGGKDFARSQFDRVAQTKRQLGSTVKPFIYLAALERFRDTPNPYTVRSILIDEPLSIRLGDGTDWEPHNYDKKFSGPVTLRYALERSLNVPTVRVAQRIGFTDIGGVLRDFGISAPRASHPSAALGAVDASLLEITSAYSALANRGFWVKPRLYRSIVDSGGNTLDRSEIEGHAVISEELSFIAGDLLTGAVKRGTGRALSGLELGVPIAGKTGTSSDKRDAWFVGYLPNLAVGIWIGFDDNRTSALTGGGAAAPVAAEFLSCAGRFFEASNYVRPRAVVYADIDTETGLSVGPNCPSASTVNEIFLEGTVPPSRCELHPRDPRQPERHRRERSFWEILFG